MRRLILGCGYLGWEIARFWQAAGDEVFAMTRSFQRADQFKTAGLRPIVADITQPASFEQLPEVDTVVVAIGMDRSRYDDIRQVYVDGFKNLLQKLNPASRHLIYISSTGVYGESEGKWVTEESETNPQREGGRACLEAEGLLWSSQYADRGTVLRLAGIYGPNRIPLLSAIKSGRFDQVSVSGYLNLIHRADASTAVVRASESSVTGETLLVSDGNPPTRFEYCRQVAILAGVAEAFSKSVSPDLSGRNQTKRIDNSRMLRLLNLELEYPSYREGLDSLFRQ